MRKSESHRTLEGWGLGELDGWGVEGLRDWRAGELMDGELEG